MNAVKLEKKREKPQNLLFYLLFLRVGGVCVCVRCPDPAVGFWPASWLSVLCHLWKTLIKPTAKSTKIPLHEVLRITLHFLCFTIFHTIQWLESGFWELGFSPAVWNHQYCQEKDALLLMCHCHSKGNENDMGNIWLGFLTWPTDGSKVSRQFSMQIRGTGKAFIKKQGKLILLTWLWKRLALNEGKGWQMSQGWLSYHGSLISGAWPSCAGKSRSIH